MLRGGHRRVLFLMPITRKRVAASGIGTLIGVALVATTALVFPRFAAASSESERWKQQAHAVTIVRDDWGIAHIRAATDAQTVFGLIYAQAEDDFKRIETNYLNALGRLAETQGESAIYSDLRQKLFIDSADLRVRYAHAPIVLKKLMQA
ncbi:MAG TPA: penicillin acylase family protein, partial [Steroidobacteraceae bacterium]